jgi:hypothetical protein
MSNGKTVSLMAQLARKFISSASAICLSTAIALLSFAIRVQAQEPTTQTVSVVDAARSARERAFSSGKHSKIITNADLGAQPPVPSASAFDLQLASTNADEVSNPLPAGCDNPQAERLRVELQAAQQELDQLRRELQNNSPVVSGNDLDLQYFKPGNSGFNVGAPPLLDTEPPVPARITAVELTERIESLQKALRLVCEPPEAASIQSAIDDDERELDLFQRQFALDQEDYYSRPVTERIGDNPQLDAEQQQIQALQAEIENLKTQLAALAPPQATR